MGIDSPTPSTMNDKTKRNTIIGIVSALVLMCACIGSCNQNTPAATSSKQTTKQTAATTQKPKPTPIQLPLAFGHPYATGGAMALGGTIDAFIASYGTPTMIGNDTSSWAFTSHCEADRCPVVQVDTGKDQKNYVAWISLGDYHRTWDLATVQQICMIYTPHDSTFVKQTVDLSTGRNDNKEFIYTSPTLAAQFPADSFSSEDGLAPQGTFFIEYSFGSKPNTYTGCLIMLGE